MRTKRSPWLLPLLALASCTAVQAQALKARLDGSRLYVTAPQLRLLTDRVRVKLQNGAAVSFHFQLVALPPAGGKPLSEASDLFVLSFDLWEERFAVVQSAAPRRAASHLTAEAAEAWCLENLPIPVPPLAPDSPFVLRLEVRAEEPERDSAANGGPGLSLAGLIEVFSRKTKEPPLRWSAVSGPVRLADLKSSNGGGLPLR